MRKQSDLVCSTKPVLLVGKAVLLVGKALALMIWRSRYRISQKAVFLSTVNGGPLLTDFYHHALIVLI